MNMDEKIRRAFRSATPNILGTLESQTPQPYKKKRRKLSPRVQEFIATAASVTLLIGAVGVGIFYFRNHYSLNNGLGGDNTLPSGTWFTEPTPSVPDVSPEALITRTDDIIYPLYMRDKIYTPPDIPVELIVEDGVEKYRILREDGGYCYEFKFDAHSAQLLSIEVLECDCIKTGYISMYLAANAAFLEEIPKYTKVQFTAEEYSVTPNWDQSYFIIGLNCDGWHTMIVDSTTGELLRHDRALTDGADLDSVRDIAYAYTGVTDLSQVRLLDIGYNTELPTFSYRVTVEYGTKRFEMDIESQTGSISNINVANIGQRPEDDPEAGYISLARAKEIACDHGNIAQDTVLSFSYTFTEGEPSVYHLSFRYYYSGHHLYECSVDAKTGQVVDFRYPDMANPDKITLLDARNIALDYVNLDVRDIRELSVSICSENETFDFEVPDNELYSISIEYETYYYDITIDSMTGNILNCKELPGRKNYDESMPGVIGWASARDIALKKANVTIERMYYFSYRYLSSNVYEVMFNCDWGGLPGINHIYRVDAYTGKILTNYVDPEDHLPGGGIGNGVATDLALEHTGYTREEVSNILWRYEIIDGSDFYVISFDAQNLHYEVNVCYYVHTVWNYTVSPVEGQLAYVRDLALSHLGWDLDQAYHLSVGYLKESKNYRVGIITESECCQIFIPADCSTVEVSYSDPSRNPEDQQNTALIGWQAARDIALEHLGVALEQITEYRYEYFDNNREIYAVSVSVDDTKHTLLLDAKSGELCYSSFDETVRSIISVEELQNIVFQAAGLTEEAINEILADADRRFSYLFTLGSDYLAYSVQFHSGGTWYWFNVDLFDNFIIDQGH